MRYIRKFNESKNVKELAYDESYIYKCSMIMNLIPRGDYTGNLKELSRVINETLKEDVFSRIFNRFAHLDLLGDNYETFSLFVTEVVRRDDLLRMFNMVEVQEGSDDEDEWVATLSINNKVVLLLASPDRGNSIRVEDDNNLSMDELKLILTELCNIYNEKF